MAFTNYIIHSKSNRSLIVMWNKASAGKPLQVGVQTDFCVSLYLSVS